MKGWFGYRTPTISAERLQKHFDEAPWRRAFEPPEQEVDMIISSDCIEGKIPPNIEGTVFGNGVGRQRYGEHVYGHWFEGDGHVTSFCYKEGKVRVRNKFVDQRRYKENAAANKIVSRGPWTNVNGGVFGNAFRLSKTNPSNTSVIHHGGKLFALCEAGAPVEMGDDLSTIGERTFGDLVGSDGKACTFSAHYKIDPATGTVFNHGMVYGKDSSMSLFSWNKNLEMQKITTVPLEPNTIQFVHDSCFSKKYSTFFFDSFKADKKGLLSVLLGYKPLGYAFEEHIGEGTRVVVLNRENGTIVADMKIEDTHTYHFVTGVDRIGDDGEELLDVYFFRYMDRTGLEEFLRSVYTRTLPDAASATLWKYTFDVTHKKLISTEQPFPNALPGEFPVINGEHEGKEFPVVYAVAVKKGSGFFSALQRIDAKTGEVKLHDFGAKKYPGEPVLLEHDGSTFIQVLIFNADTNASEIHIIDDRDFSGHATAIIKLPIHVPPQFHTYYAAHHVVDM